jgi:hypothetical protein
MKIKSVLAFGLFAAAALLGMGLVYYATTAGPGVGGDATIYLTSARNLLHGEGLGWVEADGTFRLLPYAPPFYPLVLSAVGWVMPDLVSGARWLNLLLFGATILALSGLFYRQTGRFWLAGVLAGLLATSPVLLSVQVWAMAEPLFLLMGFGGLALFLFYQETHRRYLLLLSALLVGLALLARYIGIAFVAAVGIVLLWEFWRGANWPASLAAWNGEPLSRMRRGADLVLFAFIALLPVVVWVVVDLALTGTVSSRSGQPASVYWQRFLEMGPALERIYLFWLLPESVVNRLPWLARLILWLAPLAGLLALTNSFSCRFAQMLGEEEPQQAARLAAGARLALLMALFSILYLAILAGVQIFTYPPVTLAARMLSPVHLAVLVLLAALAHLGLVIFSPGRRWLIVVIPLAVMALLGTYGLRGTLVAREYHQAGIGYNAPAWRNTMLIEAVRDLPASVPLISNEVTALMYLADRPAYTVQEIYQDQPLTLFTTFGEGPDEAQRVFREAGGALVLFYETLDADFAMYGEQSGERLAVLTRGLYRYYEGEEGAIFFNHPSALQFITTLP